MQFDVFSIGTHAQGDEAVGGCKKNGRCFSGELGKSRRRCHVEVSKPTPDLLNQTLPIAAGVSN
jgi:hypothetical protein